MALNTKEKNVLRMLLILTYRDRGSNKASKKRQINKNQLINRFCVSERREKLEINISETVILTTVVTRFRQITKHIR